MKLSGANFIELSLSLGFAVIVLTTSLSLVQESSRRINTSFQFQKNMLNSLKPISKMNQYGLWEWSSTIDLSNIFPNLPTNAAVNINQFEFTNNGWYTSDDQGHSTKITINYSNNQTLSIYVADYPSKQKLYGKLKMLKKALNQYNITYGT